MTISLKLFLVIATECKCSSISDSPQPWAIISRQLWKLVSPWSQGWTHPFMMRLGQAHFVHRGHLQHTPALIEADAFRCIFCKHKCIKSSLHIGLLVAFNRFDSELRVIGKNIMTGPGRQRVWLVGVSYLHIKWSEKRDVKVFNDYLQTRGQCRLITLCVPATEGVTTWHSFAYCGKLDKLKLRNLKLQHWWKKSKLFLIQFYFQ